MQYEVDGECQVWEFAYLCGHLNLHRQSSATAAGYALTRAPVELSRELRLYPVLPGRKWVVGTRSQCSRADCLAGGV